jgi:hypothetical protein
MPVWDKRKLLHWKWHPCRDQISMNKHILIIKLIIMRVLRISVLLLILPVYIFAQDTFGLRSTYFSAGFLQIKESANFGLVFRGPTLNAGMSWNILHGNRVFFYEFQFELAAPMSKGVVGEHTNIKPVEFAYAWQIHSGQFDLKIGPALKMEYKLEYYSDLQSGYNYWLTSYCMGLSAFTSVPVKKSMVRLRLYNSLAGFASKNEIYDDPYFFDPGFVEIMKDFHSDFKFVTLGSFNNTSFELRFKISDASRMTVSYVFDYCVYMKSPDVRYLNHSVRLNFNSRKRNEK